MEGELGALRVNTRRKIITTVLSLHQTLLYGYFARGRWIQTIIFSSNNAGTIPLTQILAEWYFPVYFRYILFLFCFSLALTEFIECFECFSVSEKKERFTRDFNKNRKHNIL